MKKISTLLCCFCITIFCLAQENRFQQLGELLPTPNSYRSASGAPGSEYWQVRADYDMVIKLDDENQKIYGEESINFHNNSPDELKYLWVQLDQNVRAKDSQTHLAKTHKMSDKMSMNQLERLDPSFDGGFKLDYVKDSKGAKLNYMVNNTMMRIDLKETLKPGQSFRFSIKWWYNINNRMQIGGRSGYEYFEEDDNYLYTIAQFFPRMCSYNDVDGWQNKQFLGRGEFTLIFGDYDVKITVPDDHQVAATGTLENPKSVMTGIQLKRFEQAKKSFETPVIIVTEEDARKNEETKGRGTKTWHFKAENVRDFAFANSRKFIWDAMAVQLSDRTVLAMSMYPKEGNPLWEKYSTKVVAHTLKWYSHYTFDYPYPVAWSIHAASIGMEYPMICFNFGRPEKDGTYTARTKYGMIGVIIHEVGHNYFPMIVNSDERQWTWMDEGLNTFLQYLTEQQLEREYPSRRGPANKITDYMGGDKERISPIMTNSESIYQFGNNAYGKPATALNILRETVMGRELFDHAFKEFSNRWKFKSPSPADFFRTMEDASAVDLDWFWRGWFYTTEHCDMALSDVSWLKAAEKDPIALSERKNNERNNGPKNISEIRNLEEIKQTQNEIDTALNDFYTQYDALDYDVIDQDAYSKFLETLSEEEKALMQQDKNYYQITIENKGGLIMPVILQFNYTDGTNEVVRLPAEIWRMDEPNITKTFARAKDIESIVLDPFLETADTDTSNNYFPEKKEVDRFELFKQHKRNKGENPMQRADRAGRT